MQKSLKQRPLLVWHPGVHNLFAESLYFFLIRAKYYDGKFRTQIEDFLDVSNARGCSVYEVLGDYDLLVRVWMTKLKRDSFRSRLENHGEVYNYEEFACDRIRYLWTAVHTGPETYDSVARTVAKHGGTDVLAAFQRDPSDVVLAGTLQAAGLLMELRRGRHPRSFRRNTVKFFSFLNTMFPVRDTLLMSGLTHLLADDGDLKECMQHVTIHSGPSQSPFLLKGVSQSIYKAYEGIRRITAAFRLQGLTSRTYVPAIGGVDESDDIDFAVTRHAAEHDLYLNVLGVGPSQLAALDRRTRRRFEEKFDELAERNLFQLYSDRIIREPFVAMATKDCTILEKELHLLVQVERLLREALGPIAAAGYGDPNWARTKRPELVTRVRIDPPSKNLNCYTLHDAICLLGAVDADTGYVSQVLPAGWESALRDAVSVRDKWAHGRLVDLLAPDTWESIVDLIAELLPIYHRLRDLAEKRSRFGVGKNVRPRARERTKR